MRQDPPPVPQPRSPYEQADRTAGHPGPAPRTVAPEPGALIASLRREQRTVKRWMAAGVIILAALLALAGYAVASHQMTSHLETMGPVLFLTGIANLRLSARRLARLRAAEASVLAGTR